MKRAVEFIVRHPWWVLWVTVVVTAILGFQMTRVRMVIDPKTILPQHHPYVQLNNVIEEVFGGSRVVVVGIVAKQGDIFTPGILATIKTLTDEVKKIPGIKEENVISLADRKGKRGRWLKTCGRTPVVGGSAIQKIGIANRGWAGGGAPSRLPMDSGWGT